MTINLPEELETSIRPLVRSGQFASEEEVVAMAVREFLRRRPMRHADADPAEGTDQTPIWKVAEEVRGSIPAEEWDKLPTDGARQLDHYLYGSPRRPE